jgi:hypothetical protein
MTNYKDYTVYALDDVLEAEEDENYICTGWVPREDVAHIVSERDRLREALEEVLADHDERIRLYGWREGQTNRLRGIGLARAALREVSDDNT